MLTQVQPTANPSVVTIDGSSGPIDPRGTRKKYHSAAGAIDIAY